MCAPVKQTLREHPLQAPLLVVRRENGGFTRQGWSSPAEDSAGHPGLAQPHYQIVGDPVLCSSCSWGGTLILRAKLMLGRFLHMLGDSVPQGRVCLSCEGDFPEAPGSTSDHSSLARACSHGHAQPQGSLGYVVTHKGSAVPTKN